MSRLIELLALVLPLGLDTLAVAAVLGLSGLPGERRRRISLVMASFEAGMPLIGVALGAPLGQAVGSVAGYLAIVILVGLGLYTLLSEDPGDDDKRVGRLAGARGRDTVLLGLSISLDELAIGFTLGLLGLPVLLVVGLIAAQAVVFSQIGLRLGARMGAGLREGAERVAGLALTGLGLGLLVEKLAGG